MAAASKMYLAHYVIGAALAQQGQYPQAIEHLRSAIELQPDSTWAHFAMGSCLLKTGDYKTAVIHLEIASNRLPEFAEAHSLLAQAYSHVGRADDARREQARAEGRNSGYLGEKPVPQPFLSFRADSSARNLLLAAPQQILARYCCASE